MTGRIITPDLYRRMPWKNGGGETVEIAIFPPDADLDSFGWRISMATVASDGPFSAFPGVARTLSIFSGAGISLTVGDNDPVTLDAGSAPFTFEADLATAARLIDGPITDFNVMTRRSIWHHAVRNVPIKAGTVLPITQAVTHTIVFCRSGIFEAGNGTNTASLTANAALWVERGADSWLLRSTETGAVFVVEIEAVVT